MKNLLNTVYIERNLEDIKNDLSNKDRPSLNLDFDQTFAKREPEFL